MIIAIRAGQIVHKELGEGEGAGDWGDEEATTSPRPAPDTSV